MCAESSKYSGQGTEKGGDSVPAGLPLPCSRSRPDAAPHCAGVLAAAPGSNRPGMLAPVRLWRALDGVGLTASPVGGCTPQLLWVVPG